MSMPWYGELPERWMLRRVGTQFSENATSNKGIESDIPMQFRYGEIIRKKATEKDEVFLNSIKRYTLIQQNDIIINGLNLNYDFVSQRVAIAREKGCITPAYISMQSMESINPFFACYLLKAMDGQKVLHGLGTGIRLTLGFAELKKVYLPLPPRDEQDQIVRYLDWKASRINKLIYAKRRQIELLEEQKRAMVFHAVESPERPQTRIGHLYTSILGKMLASVKESESETYEKYLCAKDVHFEGIDITSNKEMWFTQDEKKEYRVKIGDLLIVEGGAGAGGSFVFDYDTEDQFYIQNSIQIIRSKGSSSNKFLYYYMYSLVKRGYIDCVCEKATIPHFTKERLLNTSIPVIPFDEQIEIVSLLDVQCSRIDKAMEDINKEIALFVEYRTRLTSDVVTGKLDVRGIVIPEYEAVEDLSGDEDDENIEEEVVE